ENDNDPLEKEWLKFVTIDNYTLSKYGKAYFRVFIECNKPKLIRDTYEKCIDLVKTNTEKNFNFLDIINSSTSILIEKDPDYLSRFMCDMLILLNPTKDHSDKINSNHQVHSDCKSTSCFQLSLRYHIFRKYTLRVIVIIFVLVYVIPFIVYFIGLIISLIGLSFFLIIVGFICFV